MRRSMALWLAISTGVLMVLCAALFAWVQMPERERQLSDIGGGQFRAPDNLPLLRMQRATLPAATT
jgi:hypothetical protein